MPNSSKAARKNLASERTASGLERTALFEKRLAGILKDLARILVANGYGISSLSWFAKRAYFEAAQELAPGRRKSKAQIAAITGLTRSEVSELYNVNEALLFSKPVVSRAQRVSLGWASDVKYRGKKGKPAVLPYSGRKTSFEGLVREYGADIPAKAMLSEMTRLGLVRKKEKNSIVLVRVEPPISRHTEKTLRALSPWVRFLSCAEGHQKWDLDANAVQITLSFDSMPQLFAAVRELQYRASTFVESIHELSDKRLSATRKQLMVSVALGTRVPQTEEFSRNENLRL
jgi:hypothetical protein